MPTKTTTGKTKTTKNKKAIVKKTSSSSNIVKTKKEIVETKQKTKKTDDKKRYWEGIGRRKTSTARVRIFSVRPFESKKPKITVNNSPYDEIFKWIELKKAVEEPLKIINLANRLEVTVKVEGGGVRGQAEAIRHGLSRALVEFNPDFRRKLHNAGFLKRDPRMKERRKPGLKKARKAPQWSKR